MRNPLPLFAVVVLAACGLIPREAPVLADPAPSVTDAPDDTVLRPLPRPIPGATPAPAANADGRLGETLASLGAPGEAGLWLRTGLVTSVQAGRIVAAGGQSLDVELRPSGAEPGAGSQISLAAMRALGLPLGQLATLSVFVR